MGVYKNLNVQEGCFFRSVLELQNYRGEGRWINSLPPVHVLFCLFVLCSFGSTGSPFLSPALSELRRVFLASWQDRLIAQTCSKDGLRRSVQPQAVGVPVTEGHRQGDVHRLCPGEKQRHRRALLQVSLPSASLCLFASGLHCEFNNLPAATQQISLLPHPDVSSAYDQKWGHGSSSLSCHSAVF